jgi:1-acyl-sn-glycerol-3-phosphate acyltransferase
MALAVPGMALIMISYFLACLLLLPWRMRRLRLGNRAGAALGRWIHATAGLSHELRGPSPESLAPAIFVQNHTGTLDLFLAMQICPAPGSGTLKKEFLKIPFIGLGYSLSGHLLIDRTDRERAIRSMAEIVELVKNEGVSVWILPEGTRSRSGRLAPFKKGFAHMALETRLPIVPIVVHQGHRFWPRGLNVRPGRVCVEVLPPISTRDWTSEAMAEQIAEVENAFIEALAPDQRPEMPGADSPAGSAGAA